MMIKIQGHLSPGPHHFPAIMDGPHKMMMITFAIFLFAATTTTRVQAGPARMLSSGTNKIISTSSHATNPELNNGNNNNAHQNSPSAPHAASNIPEEELELESLKGSAPGGTGGLSKKSVEESSTSKPLAYVKKPENEETPALSDNANSLKYGGANADLEEALANMAHIPPSKLPSLSVQTGGIGGINTGVGGGTSSFGGFPLGDSILQKRARSTGSSNFGGNNNGGLGLLSRSGGAAAAAAGVNLEVDYTPQDIAEYIFWMGDERGVEMALSDFVQDGLITAQDAVRFLEDVKAELSLLRNRYSSTVNLGKNTGMEIPTSHDERGFWEVPARTMSKKQSSYFSGNSDNYGGYYSPPVSSNNGGGSSVELMSNHPYYPSASGTQSASQYKPYGGIGGGNMYKDIGGTGLGAKSGSVAGASSGISTNSIEDMLDYEEIVDKLRQADSKMREVALEGIIYQLARELFSMGLQQSADSSVPAFTKFIETLSVNGNISKDLERSVLETLVQALVDAANERGLLNAKSSSSTSSSSHSAPSISSIERQLSNLSGKSSGSDTQKPNKIIKKKSV